MRTASEEVADRAHLSGIAIGLRAQATTEPDSNLVGSDLIIFGFAAVARFHREGMPQDTGYALLCPQVRQPMPGTHTLDGHNEPCAVRGDGLEKKFRCGLHVAVQQDFSIVMHNADVHAPS